MSEAVRYLSERHDDGRLLTGEYRVKVSVPLGDGMAPAGGGWVESSEVARVYFAERPDAEAAYERVKALAERGESVTLEKRRNLSRPFEWDVIEAG
ncbi:hypothetical protein [Brevibacterium oceani]|uniref:hypothetical protein n=1 Tax=Brevibacterium oceani TaxID=358099 RepID=UPI0015E6DE91|nr:hypothetical protein [Brevibacterium oceani]